MTSDLEFSSPAGVTDHPLTAPAVVISTVGATTVVTEAVRQSEAVRERIVDAVLEDSFPASDPPCWTLGYTGGRTLAAGDSMPDDRMAGDRTRVIARGEQL